MIRILLFTLIMLLAGCSQNDVKSAPIEKPTELPVIPDTNATTEYPTDAELQHEPPIQGISNVSQAMFCFCNFLESDQDH